MALERGLSRVGVHRNRTSGSRLPIVILVFFSVLAPLIFFVGRGFISLVIDVVTTSTADMGPVSLDSFRKGNLAASWKVIGVESSVEDNASSEDPSKHLFHLVTDELNFGAMNVWFLLNPPGKATIHVKNVDEFKWLNSFYLNGAAETCGPVDDKYRNFSNPYISRNFNPNAWGGGGGGGAYGMNMFDLKEWKKRGITGIYHKWENMNDDRVLWKLGRLPPGLITFYGLTHPLEKSCHVLGLGYNPSIGMREIERATVIHYNSNMKPWAPEGLSFNYQVSTFSLSFLGVGAPEGWCYPHRFGSVAAPQKGLNEGGSQAQWFIDGKSAFEEIASSIEKAKSEIFITGWWLCLKLSMRRPFEGNSSSRLDALLESKAKEGVQIYILLYKVVSIALKINSFSTRICFVTF
ncbi:Glycosyl transferase, family 8, partial [Corchorus capsularis]